MSDIRDFKGTAAPIVVRVVDKDRRVITGRHALRILPVSTKLTRTTTAEGRQPASPSKASTTPQ